MDVFDEIAAGLRPRVPPAPTAIAKRCSDAELRLGYDLAKKFGESKDITHAIQAHHEDVPPRSVVATLVPDSLPSAQRERRRRGKPGV